jgi:hypothetical protein
MTKDKQLEEIARTICCCYENGICNIDRKPCDLYCGSMASAKKLYEIDYRKASEVAREIFEEIEKFIYSKCYSVRADRDVTGLIIDGEQFAELKKKYTEEK